MTLPFHWLQKAQEHFPKVAYFKFQGVSKTHTGMAFLITPTLWLTTYTAINAGRQQSEMRDDSNGEARLELEKRVRHLHFRYATMEEPENLERDTFGKLSLCHYDPQRNFALIRCQEDTLKEHTKKYGHMLFAEAKAPAGIPLNILQLTGTKWALSIRGNELSTALSDAHHTFQFQTENQLPVPGAPICNDRWEVLGLHTAEPQNTDQRGQHTRYLTLNVREIFKELPCALKKELRQAQPVLRSKSPLIEQPLLFFGYRLGIALLASFLSLVPFVWTTDLSLLQWPLVGVKPWLSKSKSPTHPIVLVDLGAKWKQKNTWSQETSRSQCQKALKLIEVILERYQPKAVAFNLITGIAPALRNNKDAFSKHTNEKQLPLIASRFPRLFRTCTPRSSKDLSWYKNYLQKNPKQQKKLIFPYQVALGSGLHDINVIPLYTKVPKKWGHSKVQAVSRDFTMIYTNKKQGDTPSFAQVIASTAVPDWEQKGKGKDLPHILPIHWGRSFPILSPRDLFKSSTRSNQLNGAIVVMGVVFGASEKEKIDTPASNLSGTEVQAHIVDTLVNGPVPQPLPFYATWLLLVLFILVGAVQAWIFQATHSKTYFKHNKVGLLILSVILLLCLVLTGTILLQKVGWILPVLLCCTFGIGSFVFENRFSPLLMEAETTTKRP